MMNKNQDLISRSQLYNLESLLMIDIVANSPTAKFVLEQVLYDIENIEAVDFVEVMYGQWETIEEREYLGVKCSNCQKWFNSETSYCPNCGAKMKGKAKHEKL